MTVLNIDCLLGLQMLADNSVDAIVTDPPYGLSFMGKKWDYDVPSEAIWRECLRVLKPGAHLLAFAGTRTQHRMAVRIEDAGFDIRDMIAWVYGSGFPKSLDVSKAIDKLDAAEARRHRQLKFTEWMRSTGLTAARIDEITGTSMGGHYVTAASQPSVSTREFFEILRPHFGCDVPAWVEQMVDERTVESENFKRREVVGRSAGGLGAGNFTAEKVGAGGYGFGVEFDITLAHTEAARQWQGWGTALKPALEPITVARKPLVGTVAENVMKNGTGAVNIDGGRVEGGRYPANLIHDGSDEVVALFPDSNGAGGSLPNVKITGYGDGIGTGASGYLGGERTPFDSGKGSAARFFYCAKASKRDRNEGNNHPTVKPTDLMRYLCRLVTPPGGVVLDPFAGSGSTGKAATLEGFQFIGFELDPDYVRIANARIEGAKR